MILREHLIGKPYLSHLSLQFPQPLYGSRPRGGMELVSATTRQASAAGRGRRDIVRRPAGRPGQTGLSKTRGRPQAQARAGVTRGSGRNEQHGRNA